MKANTNATTARKKTTTQTNAGQQAPNAPQEELHLDDTEPQLLLVKAANDGKIAEVKKLLDAGAKADTTETLVDADGTIIEATALAFAARHGHLNIVKLLLAQKADAAATCTISHNDESTTTTSALALAAQNGYYQIVEALVEAGASARAVVITAGKDSREECAPLILALNQGYTQTAQTLLNNGARHDDVRVVKYSNDTSITRTALWEAANAGSADSVLLLLNSGADVNAANILVDKEGKAFDKAKAIEIAASRLLNATTSGTSEQKDKARDVFKELMRGGADLYAYKDIPFVTELSKTIKKEAPQHELIHAAKNGDTARVRKLLDAGVDPETVTRSMSKHGVPAEANALNWAAVYGHIGTVELLLQYGAKPNMECKRFKDTGGTEIFTSLSGAGFSGHTGIVRLLLQNGASANTGGRAYDRDGVHRTTHPTLVQAANQGRTEIVNLLLEYGADVDSPSIVVDKDKKGENHSTALFCAVFSGHLDVVDALMKAGADASRGATTVKNNQPPAINAALYVAAIKLNHSLHQATPDPRREQKQAVFKTLLLAGGISFKTVKSALIEIHPDVIQMVTEAEVKVTLQKALIDAAATGNTAKVQTLLNEGADVNFALQTSFLTADKGRSFESSTALYHASRYGHADTVKALLDAGADVHQVSKKFLGINGCLYYTGAALTGALIGGHTAEASLLLDAGANANAETISTYSDGSTKKKPLLHTAALNGHLDIVKLLLAAGANPNAIETIRDKDGKSMPSTSPLQVVVTNLSESIKKGDNNNTDKHEAIFKALVGAGATIPQDIATNRYFKRLITEAKQEAPAQAAQADNAPKASELRETAVNVHVVAETEEAPKAAAPKPASPNKTDGQPLEARQKALFKAVRKGDAGKVQKLLGTGVDVNHVLEPDDNFYGSTVLIEAALMGNTEMVNILLTGGADVHMTSARPTPKGDGSQEASALFWAAFKGHSDTVKALLARGADANAEVIVSYENKNTSIRSALSSAALHGDVNIVKALLDGGANADAGRLTFDQNNNFIEQESALHIIAEKLKKTFVTRSTDDAVEKDKAIFKALVNAGATIDQAINNDSNFKSLIEETRKEAAAVAPAAPVAQQNYLELDLAGDDAEIVFEKASAAQATKKRDVAPDADVEVLAPKAKTSRQSPPNERSTRKRIAADDDSSWQETTTKARSGSSAKETPTTVEPISTRTRRKTSTPINTTASLKESALVVNAVEEESVVDVIQATSAPLRKRQLPPAETFVQPQIQESNLAMVNELRQPGADINAVATTVNLIEAPAHAVEPASAPEKKQKTSEDLASWKSRLAALEAQNAELRTQMALQEQNMFSRLAALLLQAAAPTRRDPIGDILANGRPVSRDGFTDDGKRQREKGEEINNGTTTFAEAAMKKRQPDATSQDKSRGI